MGSTFSGNVRNECRNSLAKFGGAARRCFYAIWKKPQGGGADNRPLPVGARVNTIILIPTNYEDLQYSPSFTENWYEQVMFLGLSTHENTIH